MLAGGGTGEKKDGDVAASYEKKQCDRTEEEI